ncbi:MAG: UDP-2,4-diacetamido-2,4,6-trideoxy-beta-L-altropyranose hydrolase [Bacteroidia bacterium]
MKPNIIIRADGGTSIGMGHVVRCLALADMLKNNFNITFAIQEPADAIVKNIHSVTQMIIHLPVTNDYNADAIHFSEFLNSNDIVVLDGYHFKTEYQKVIKDKGCKLVCIDDLHNWHFVADAVINHAAGISESMYSAEKYTQFYFGLKYALLRKEFLKPSPPKKINSIKKIFISMGAADSNNLTQKFTEALLEIKGIEEIHLVLGSINPNLRSIENLIEKNKLKKIIQHFNIPAEELAQLIKESDVVICPASSISIESCAIGTGLISGYTADNQLDNLAAMEKLKILINWGNLIFIPKDKIKEKFNVLFNQTDLFNVLIANQQKIIDGQSPARILSIFEGLLMS